MTSPNRFRLMIFRWWRLRGKRLKGGEFASFLDALFGLVCLFFFLVISRGGHWRDTVFGVGLCRLFNAAEQTAPAVVLRLCQEVEARSAAAPSLDLYRLYRTSPQAGAVDDLRNQLCEGPSSNSLSLSLPSLPRFP